MKRDKQPRPVPKPRRTGVADLIPVLAGLVALTVAVYWNSLSGQFVFDDQQLVIQNPLLLNIHTLTDVTKLGMGWRQLLSFTYGLNFYWSGVETTSYHVVNLVLHLVDVVLVYFIILEIAANASSPAVRQASRYAAWTGAAVFAVHTLFSSAVSYIAGRSSVLCGVFYFLAVLLFLKALNSQAKRSSRLLYLAAAGFSGLMALQAKQEAIALPVVCAALLWLRSEKKDLRYVAALAVLPLVIAASMWKQIRELFATVSANTTLITAGFDAVLPPATYFRTYVTSVVGYYFPRFLFPAKLNADPHVLPVSHWYSPEFLVSVFILGGLVWFVIRRHSAQMGQTDALLRTGIAVVLASPLAAYAFIPLADVVLEHRAYIPGLGVAILAAALFCRLSTEFQASRLIAPLLVVFVFAVMTIQRNTVFANNVTLWEDSVQKSPQKARSHFNLGAAYQTSQRPNEAVREYQIALSLKPDMHAAYSNIAAVYLDSGRLDDAEKTLVKLTEIAPRYTEAFINLSVVRIRKKDADKAIAAAERAIALNPDAFAAHFNKGEALTLKGDFDAAVPSYERAIYLRPDLTSFRMNLGAAYVRAGNFKMAEKTYQELTATPLAAEAWRNLGDMYESVNQRERAIEDLKKAVQLKPAYAEAHHDLGVIYMKQNLLDLALEELRISVTQQPAYGPAVLNLSAVYQAKGDIAAARKVLESYLAQIGKSNSDFVQQAQARLETLR